MKHRFGNNCCGSDVEEAAANRCKCDILVKDQAQSACVPVSGIVCIFCHPASICVDSRLIVRSFVSIEFSCSTCIIALSYWYLLLCDAFCCIIDEFNCETNKCDLTILFIFQ